MASQSALLILCESSPESFRPAGERVRYLALASRSIFEKSIVLTFGNAEKRKKQEASSPVLLQKINFRTVIPFPLLAFLDPISLIMLTVHGFIASRRFKPSCILSSMPPIETGLSGLFLARFLGLKLVIDLRDDWEAATLSNLKRYFPKTMLNLILILARKVYSSSVAVLVATPTIAETVRKRGIKTLIHVLPNGANSSLFLPSNSHVRNEARLKYGLPLEKTIILYSGSGINPYNRLDVVLSSLKTLPEKVANKIFLLFYVYGGHNDLERHRQALKIPDRMVEIRNPLARSKLAEVMAACDIGLVPFDDKPSLLCARSAKLYEYLCAGLYVVSSGPEGGELDRFFSSNSHLGLFTLPNVSGFNEAFFNALGSNTDMFSESMRNLRHTFIEENYDRRKTMAKAMKTLLPAIALETKTEATH